MNRKIWLAILTLNLLLLSGCENWLLTKRIPLDHNSGPASVRDADVALQSLCDVDRIRTRNEFLIRIEAEKFRQIALKISQNVHPPDVEDLKRLDQTRRLGRELDPEIKRRRSELIQEIYQNAIIQAGFKPGQQELLEKTDFSYVASVDPVSTDIDLYVNLLVGTFEKSPFAPVTGIVLGVSPDQTRFRIGLLRVYRFDPQPDGGQIARTESLTLWEQIEEKIPHRCQGTLSALNPEEFDTLPGIQP